MFALVSGQETDCVVRPANLERADRLKILELEVNLGRRVLEIQAHQGGAKRGLVNVTPRVFDHLNRNAATCGWGCSTCINRHGWPFWSCCFYASRTAGSELVMNLLNTSFDSNRPRALRRKVFPLRISSPDCARSSMMAPYSSA